MPFDAFNSVRWFFFVALLAASMGLAGCAALPSNESAAEGSSAGSAGEGSDAVRRWYADTLRRGGDNLPVSQSAPPPPVVTSSSDASPDPRVKDIRASSALPERPAPTTPATKAAEPAAPPQTDDEPVPVLNAKHHVLQVGDSVQIDVFREPEISGVFQLTSSGVIRHPLLGDVTLVGLSTEQAEAHVRALLAKSYIVNPRVILRVESMTTSQVLVMGAVKEPGVVTFPPGESLTLLEAIVRAGGFSDMASQNRVRVVRTVDGRQKTLRVRVGDVLAGKEGHRDIELEPRDVVTVPEVFF